MTAIKEISEIGRVLNNTTYVTRFWSSDTRLHAQSQTMLIAKMSLKKGDIVKARVRILRNTRQILSLEKLDENAPQQIILESLLTSDMLNDTSLISNRSFLHDAIHNASRAADNPIAESLMTWLGRIFPEIDEWLLHGANSMERRVLVLSDIKAPPEKITPLHAAIFCDVLNSYMQYNNLVYFSLLEEQKIRLKPKAEEKAVDLFASYEWIRGVWVQPDMRPMFPVLNNVLANGEHINVLLTGPSGYGKTTFFQAIADYFEIPLLYVNCATITDTKAWFGSHEARDGSTHFIPSEFTKFIEQGNCVIVLDEANRLEPWLSNSLMPILDHRRATEVHGMQIKAAPGIIFGLTMNIGSRYAGTSIVDAAFMNRIDIGAEVEAPPPYVERALLASRYGAKKEELHTSSGRPTPELSALTPTDIDAIVGAVNDLRAFVSSSESSLDVSTRTSNKVAKLMSLGASITNAFHYVVVFAADIETRKGVLDILATRFGKK